MAGPDVLQPHPPQPPYESGYLGPQRTLNCRPVHVRATVRLPRFVSNTKMAFEGLGSQGEALFAPGPFTAGWAARGRVYMRRGVQDTTCILLFKALVYS